MSWIGGLAEWSDNEMTYLSVAFTWKLDEAYNRAQFARAHTQVHEVGHVAARAGVKTLVLSHLVPGEGAHTPEQWEALAREGAPEFEGEIVCGVDLDEFALGSAR